MEQNIIAYIASGFWGWIVANVLNHLTGKFKTEDIVLMYERRLEDKEKSIERLTKEQKKREIENLRILQSLKRSGLSTTKLVEKYNKPLNAILIGYSHQNPKGFIKDELTRYNSKWLGGEVAIIPPANVPKEIKNRDDLKKWFEYEILKGRECKLKFIILFDIKEKSYWYTYLPDSNIERIHRTIGETLSIEDLFTDEQIKTISLKDIIQNGDIMWLSSSVLSTDEIDIIRLNQANIEYELGNPSLRELANNTPVDKLSKVLEKYIKHSRTVAEAIISEAKFWYSKLK
jgi:hypothetical protein